MIINPSDKNDVLKAVKEEGNVLQYANKILKDDEDIVLVAVKQDSEAIEYTSERLQNDKKFIYLIKDIIVENKHKEIYKNIYQNLLRYEREDELNNIVQNKPSIHKKNKL